MFDLVHSIRIPRGRHRSTRLGEWWPAALIGLAVLVGLNPQVHAEAAKQGAQGTEVAQVASDVVISTRWRLADFTVAGSTPVAIGQLSGN